MLNAADGKARKNCRKTVRTKLLRGEYGHVEVSDIDVAGLKLLAVAQLRIAHGPCCRYGSVLDSIETWRPMKAKHPRAGRPD